MPAPAPTLLPNQSLRWGILATGRIAGIFARGVAASRTGQVVAVGSRTAASAARFAHEHGIPPEHTHASYAALLADPAVEAVYIATPHPEHLVWVERAAAAGKAVLCEKPAGLNLAQAQTMLAATRAAKVLLMEAYMYRCHPQTAQIVEWVRAGVIGEVKWIQASFGFHCAFDPASRLWNKALGGGAILDVGGYPMSFARLIAGAATQTACAEPLELTGTGQLHPQTGVDVYAAATLRFPGNIVAQLGTAIGLNLDPTARIYGTEGWIEIPHPWIITQTTDTLELRLHRQGSAAAEIHRFPTGNVYALEADAFADALRADADTVPAMSPADTLGNLAALDRWRTALDLR